jgi:sterol desaturase/sphingolipid hydroxylase (fatty acid hydroxylase superfamily)
MVESMDNENLITASRIFKNNFLERLTHTSPLITIIYYPILIFILSFIGFYFAGNSIGEFFAFYFSGIFSWSLIEYFMHRYVFHINEHVDGTEKFQHVIHGIHHKNPKDRERIFMPPVPGTIILFALNSLFYLLLGNSAFPFTAGMLNGYLVYSFIHYTIHTKSPHPRFRKLWQHHSLHHYRYPDKAFGVSSPLWDYVFGTMPPKEK